MTLDNPYLAAFEACKGERYDTDSDNRAALVRRYAWAVPTRSAVLAIVARGPVVEIGAGSGYWASLIRQAGGDVLAFDIAVGEREHIGTHHPVLRGGPEDAGAHPERTLFLCWPPYDEPMANDALAAYEAAGGQSVVYIGEGSTGCTGDDAFHARLRSLAWEYETSCQLPNWSGIHDDMSIHQRAL
jgi:hypothetical protein